MIAFGIVVSVILFAIGAPLYIAFGLGGLIIAIFYAGFSLKQLAFMYFASMNSFVLLGAPLFILAGNLMVHGGMGKPLVAFLSSLVGRVAGGLAIATIIASLFIGALTGMIVACLAIVGLIMFPAMVKAGYDKGYAGGVLCIAANLGTLIPPSVVFILFGFLTNASVADLFLAGVFPGFVLAALLSIVAVVIAKRRGFPLMPAVGWRERGSLFKKALPGVFMPVIVLGGIYGGIFTPTEAAAVACVYCIIIGVFVYRGLSWKNFWTSVSDTVRITTMLLVMVAGAVLLAKAFTVIGFTQAITSWVAGAGLGPMGFLSLFVLVVIALGFIMDSMAIMFVMIPLILPTAAMMDINLIHLGVVFAIGAMIGLVTPPVAAQLYTTSALFDIPVEKLMRGVLPFLGVMVIVQVIVLFVPEISTWLPSLLHPGT